MTQFAFRSLGRPAALLALVLLLPSGALAGEAEPSRPALWGTPGAAGGACCATLGEVRANIDRIDAAIVKLMAERGTFVREAARFKPSATEVVDEARVERIIGKVRRLAADDHLSPEVAEATYRAMIQAFTAEERKAFDAK